MVRIAARHHLFEMNCLRRALALRWLLALRGIPVRLEIGVDRGEDGLAAHAWVEIDGTRVGEGDGERFLPLRRAGESGEAAGSALGAL